MKYQQSCLLNTNIFLYIVRTYVICYVFFLESSESEVQSIFFGTNSHRFISFYVYIKYAYHILDVLPYVKKNLPSLPEHRRSPTVFGWVRVAYSLVVYIVSCVLLFVFFIYSHGVVNLFSFYEFDCPSGIFRPFCQ